MEPYSPLVIAEIGNSHEGSLGIALSMVDIAANAGADIVKFQLHIAEFESTSLEPFRTDDFTQDVDRQSYWSRVGFTLDEWKLIKNHCDLNSVEFLCTPFSVEAAQLLFHNGLVKRWKIGSGEITNFQLMDFVFNTKLEVLVSTGLGNDNDIDKLVAYIKQNYDLDQLVLFHCVSQYPTNLEYASLNLIQALIDKYSVRVGHSDHSGSKSASFFALSYPISYLEVHLAPHKLFFGPDTSSSLTPRELLEVVQYRNDIFKMKHSNFTKNQLFEMSKSTAKMFRKSLFWASNMNKGQLIEQGNIIIRKPWIGLDASRLSELLGKKVKSNVLKGDPIKEEDFE